MSRTKMNDGDKKRKITVSITPQMDDKLEELKINKSKLINWLLEQHFDKLK